MKNKDLCDYDPRCIMSSGLVFDDIIMGKIKRNELPNHHAETDGVFTHIVSNIIYMYTESLQDFSGRKELTSVWKCHVNISVEKRMKLKILGPTYLKMTLQEVIWMKW